MLCGSKVDCAIIVLPSLIFNAFLHVKRHSIDTLGLADTDILTLHKFMRNILNLCHNVVVVVRCFDSARLVFIHVTKTHVPAVPESVCQWQGCEPLRRKRWSLVTHLQVSRLSASAESGMTFNVCMCVCVFVCVRERG